MIILSLFQLNFRMKVAIFLDSFPTYSETFIYNQIYYLADKYVDFKIFSIKKGNSNITHSKVSQYRLIDNVVFLRHGFSLRLLNNFFLYFLTSLTILRLFSIKKSLFIILNLDIFSKLDQYQITHCHFGHIGNLICELIELNFLNKTKVINSFHGFDILPHKTGYYKNKYRSLFKFSSIFTVNSKYTYSIFEEIIDHRKEDINIIPVSLDTVYFNKCNVRFSNIVRLIFIGRLISWKAPLFCLEILKRIRNKGYPVHLTIVGDGEEMLNCKEFIQDNGLNEIVELTGALDQDAIINKLWESDIYIMPGVSDPKSGRAEAQGLVIQEAQAMNLPVVVSSAGGMKYGMIDGETGFVVDERNVDGFVEKISWLIDNPKKRIEMGRKGREYVVENFDYRVLGAKLLNIYNSLV